MGNNLNIAAGLDEAVVLGNHSTTTGSHPIANVTEATVGNLTYSGFKGTVAGAGSFVSVGAVGDERKIDQMLQQEIFPRLQQKRSMVHNFMQ